MGTLLAVADAAQVFLHGVAVAGQPRPRGTGSSGASLDRLDAFPTGMRPSPPAARPTPAGRHDHPRRIRHERVEQLDLDPDHRVESRRFGRGHEPDGPVQPAMIRDREAAQAQLDGPLDEVVGRGRTVEKREARVAVELGVRSGCHGHGSRSRGPLDDPSILEQMFCSCHPRVAKHLGGSRRLTAMQTQLRPIAIALGRYLAMVALAALLILVLLPAAIAAQAATTV